VLNEQGYLPMTNDLAAAVKNRILLIDLLLLN